MPGAVAPSAPPLRATGWRLGDDIDCGMIARWNEDTKDEGSIAASRKGIRHFDMVRQQTHPSPARAHSLTLYTSEPTSNRTLLLRHRPLINSCYVEKCILFRGYKETLQK